MTRFHRLEKGLDQGADVYWEDLLYWEDWLLLGSGVMGSGSGDQRLDQGAE